MSDQVKGGDSYKPCGADEAMDKLGQKVGDDMEKQVTEGSSCDVLDAGHCGVCPSCRESGSYGAPLSDEDAATLREFFSAPPNMSRRITIVDDAGGAQREAKRLGELKAVLRQLEDKKLSLHCPDCDRDMSADPSSSTYEAECPCGWKGPGDDLVRREWVRAESTPQGVAWADIVKNALGLAQLALALQATCPECGLHPVLGIQNDEMERRPGIWFMCTCGAHTVDGGLFHSDEQLVGILRMLPAIWLKNHRGGV